MNLIILLHCYIKEMNFFVNDLFFRGVNDYEAGLNKVATWIVKPADATCIIDERNATQPRCHKKICWYHNNSLLKK